MYVMNGNDSHANSHLKNGGFFFRGGGGEGAYANINMVAYLIIFNMKSAYKTKSLRHNQEELTLCVKSGEKKVGALEFRS